LQRAADGRDLERRQASGPGRHLEDPVRAKELGAAGIRRVCARFLIPRLLRDRLRVLRELIDGS
jgi:hypothetical protein